MTIYEALGTTKTDNETWTELFDRLNSTRGIDIKTIIKVLIYILEQLDDSKTQTIAGFSIGDTYTDHTVTTGDTTEYIADAEKEHILSGNAFGTEEKPVSKRTKRTTKKV